MHDLRGMIARVASDRGVDQGRRRRAGSCPPGRSKSQAARSPTRRRSPRWKTASISSPAALSASNRGRSTAVPARAREALVRIGREARMGAVDPYRPHGAEPSRGSHRRLDEASRCLGRTRWFAGRRRARPCGSPGPCRAAARNQQCGHGRVPQLGAVGNGGRPPARRIPAAGRRRTFPPAAERRQAGANKQSRREPAPQLPEPFSKQPEPIAPGLSPA